MKPHPFHVGISTVVLSLLLLLSSCTDQESPSQVSLPKPTNLTVTPVHLTNRVNLEWHDNSSFESGFILERRKEYDIWECLANLPYDVTTYADTLPEAEVTYSYRVAAVFESDYSDWSYTVQVKIHNVQLENPPDHLAAYCYGEDKQVILTWICESYNVFYCMLQRRQIGQHGLVWEDVDRLVADPEDYQQGFFYRDEAPEYQTIYQYRVNAANDSSASEWSDTVEVTTGYEYIPPPGSPVAPSHLINADTTEKFDIHLSWHDNSLSEEMYLIERLNKIEPRWDNIGNTPANITSFVDSTTSSNTIYIYRIAAWNETGRSDWSNELEVTTGTPSVSCPFIYSFNGEQYEFDAQPYEGAICEGLKRTDLCKLEHLKPKENEYLIRVTNELEEIQYLDEFKLWIVDHPSDVQVFQDAELNIYTIDSPQKPLSAVDEHGQDLNLILSVKDSIHWESDLNSRDPRESDGLHDTIYVAFPKPIDASSVKLIVNCCNTPLASHLLWKLAELRGERLEEWYELWKYPDALKLLDIWNNREEIFQLQVFVFTNGSWNRRGEIAGGGIYIPEERVVPLDLAGVEGDTLKIRLTPPVGFWRLNSFAVDYSQDCEFDLQEIAASSMFGHDGSDLSALLDTTDGDYYIMDFTGQSAEFAFPVPELRLKYTRTVFTKVAGYYNMKINAVGPYQSGIIDSISYKPGYVTRFALRECSKYRMNR